MEGLLSLVELFDHAEAVAVGVFQHHEVVVRAVLLGVPSRPDPEQPLDFALPVARVEVQVHPAGLAEGGSNRRGTRSKDKLGPSPSGSRSTTQPSLAGSLGPWPSASLQNDSIRSNS
jgi:hypothetical protein